MKASVKFRSGASLAAMRPRIAQLDITPVIVNWAANRHLLTHDFGFDSFNRQRSTATSPIYRRDNGQCSPRKLLRAVVARLLGGRPSLLPQAFL